MSTVRFVIVVIGAIRYQLDDVSVCCKVNVGLMQGCKMELKDIWYFFLSDASIVVFPDTC